MGLLGYEVQHGLCTGLLLEGCSRFAHSGSAGEYLSDPVQAEREPWLPLWMQAAILQVEPLIPETRRSENERHEPSSCVTLLCAAPASAGLKLGYKLTQLDYPYEIWWTCARPLFSGFNQRHILFAIIIRTRWSFNIFTEKYCGKYGDTGPYVYTSEFHNPCCMLGLHKFPISLIFYNHVQQVLVRDKYKIFYYLSFWSITHDWYYYVVLLAKVLRKLPHSSSHYPLLRQC